MNFIKKWYCTKLCEPQSSPTSLCMHWACITKTSLAVLMVDAAACSSKHTAKHTNKFYLQWAKCVCVSVGGAYIKQICFQELFENVTKFVECDISIRFIRLILSLNFSYRSEAIFSCKVWPYGPLLIRRHAAVGQCSSYHAMQQLHRPAKVASLGHVTFYRHEDRLVHTIRNKLR